VDLSGMVDIIAGDADDCYRPTNPFIIYPELASDGALASKENTSPLPR
jgi:hypothetical protein